MPGLGHARCLRMRGGGRNMRVQATARSGDNVGGYSAGERRVFLAERIRVGLYALQQFGIGRTKVGSAGVSGVVSVVARRRRTSMKILRLRELLSEQFRADDLAIY